MGMCHFQLTIKLNKKKKSGLTNTPELQEQTNPPSKTLQAPALLKPPLNLLLRAILVRNHPRTNSVHMCTEPAGLLRRELLESFEIVSRMGPVRVGERMIVGRRGVARCALEDGEGGGLGG